MLAGRPWCHNSGGRTLVWDSMVVNTVAGSYIPETAARSKGRAEIADSRSTPCRHKELGKRYIFVPVAVETFSFPTERGPLAFLSETGDATKVRPVILAKQASSFRDCQRWFSLSTRWGFRAPFQGCQELKGNDSGTRTYQIAMTMMNKSD